VDDVQRKSLSAVEWKADKAGAFRAVVATYGVIDKDGDVTEPGALDTERPILVSPWNHSSIADAQSDLPVGTAKISTVGDSAVAEGRFFTETDDGKRAYQITKALHEEGLGEWSYGFRIPAGGASTDPKALDEYPGAVRLLKRVMPFEVSLVFSGAGVDTRTISVKSAIEAKRGARLSKESRDRLRALASDLLVFIGEAEDDPADPPKAARVHQGEALIPSHDDAELQAFLRAARDDMEHVRQSRLVDLRLI
jgi:hypothetical protein